ncbi:MAG: DUF2807 domain-containing protein [Imperialibacter sp.]|uniref:GIN domain-containing protein n=1 Tax=Imperialibacter sp. TaxID=2038411 RepID=UPI0032ED1A0B
MRFSSRHILQLLMMTLGGLTGSACQDGFVDRCFEKYGREIVEEIELKKFTSLEIMDDIEVELVSGAFQQVVLTTYEELLPNVVFTEIDQGYQVENATTCLWNSHYKSPKLTISSPDLNFIVHRSTSPMYSKDTIQLNRLWLAIHLSYTEINLTIKTGGFVLRNYGKSNVKISGTSDYADLFVNQQVSLVDCSQLKAKVVVVEHEGLNEMKVFPTDTLRGTMSGYGNLIYFNEPKALSVEQTGTGKLLFNKP